MSKINQIKKTISMSRKWRSISGNKLWYIGGFPNILNLGDVALYEAYVKLFSSFAFIHFTGGRINSSVVKCLNLKSPAMLSGGTLINRLSYNTALDASKLFDEFYVFGTGVAQSEFWNRVDGFQDMITEWAKILEKSKFIGVRGPLSQEKLINAGLKDTKIVGDPVLTFFPREYKSYSLLEKSIGINIGVSGSNVWGNEKDILKDYTKLVSSLLSQNYKIHWFVVCPEDLEITIAAAKETETSENIHKIYSDSNEYFDLVSKMNVFIGLKLHAVVMSICRLVPSIMIEYRPKCRDFMLSIDQDDNNYRSDKINIDEIISKVNLWMKERDSVSKSLFSSTIKLVEYQAKCSKKLILPE